MSLFSPCLGEAVEKSASFRSRTLLLLILIAVPLGAQIDHPSGFVLERRLLVMGTELVLVVRASDRPAAIAASEAALRALEAAESRLSTWRPGSELSALGRSPAGSVFELSQATAGELSEALECQRWTEGAFDPTIGSLSDALGLRSGGRVPSAGELTAARAATGAHLVRVTGRRAVRLHPSVRFDEGGFGKGAGLDRAVEALAAFAGVEARLDLGGQLAFVGDGPWEADLAHPADRNLPALRLAVDGGSLATTGNSERGLTVAGRPVGHILDPRTGRPAPFSGSVTVWGTSALAADCLSTGLFVLGPERALEVASRLPGVEAIVLEPKGERLLAQATSGFAGRIARLSDGLELQIAGTRGTKD